MPLLQRPTPPNGEDRAHTEIAMHLFDAHADAFYDYLKTTHPTLGSATTAALLEQAFFEYFQHVQRSPHQGMRQGAIWILRRLLHDARDYPGPFAPYKVTPEDAQDGEAFRQAVRSLTATQRYAVWAHCAGISYRDLAEALDMTASALFRERVRTMDRLIQLMPRRSSLPIGSRTELPAQGRSVRPRWPHLKPDPWWVLAEALRPPDLATCRIDASGRTRHVSDAALALLGWEKADARNKPIHDILHAGLVVDEHICPIHAALESGDAHEVSCDRFRGDRHAIEVRYACEPVKTLFGTVAGATITFRLIGVADPDSEGSRPDPQPVGLPTCASA